MSAAYADSRIIVSPTRGSVIRVWSRKHDACVNCGTTRHRHRGKGFCTKCFGPATQLATVRTWDFANPETLRRFPSVGVPFDETWFSRVKRGYIIELEKRLHTIKWREAVLGEVVDGMTIELMLECVALRAGAQNPRMHRGLASYFESAFPPKERKALYKVLLQIEEDTRWGGVNLGRALSQTSSREG